MAITTNNPPARCLDLTRSVSRVGRGPLTGIDRVEREYLRALMASDVPLFGLVRLVGGFAILNPDGVNALAARLNGAVGWGRPDVVSYLSRKLSKQRRCAEADVRRLAAKLTRKASIRHEIARVLPPGCSYLNVGHSNISPGVMAAIRSVEGARITVLIHDTIPLDFPEFQRPGTPQKFHDKLKTVARFADQVICISQHTQERVKAHLQDMGKTPKTQVAHIGVSLTKPDKQALPPGLDLKTPYFVTVGTIEPRKNHQLLLDLWERLSNTDNPPNLYVIGQRGWNNRTIFARLDQHPPHVRELNGLPDGAVSALIQGSCGLLFPSFAEGFGLPAAEAAGLGVPVICNNLSVFHEILGQYPIYADVADMYEWETTIKRLATNCGSAKTPKQGVALAGWKEHFDLILRIS